MMKKQIKDKVKVLILNYLNNLKTINYQENFINLLKIKKL